jgi:tol-pal system protein YbgF
VPAQASAPPAPAPISPPAPIPSRRADVFDPNENPGAPGAPRTLGSIPGRPAGIPGQPIDEDDDNGIGAPGGRSAGAPLDLSTLSERAAGEPPYVAPNMPVGQPAPSTTLPPPPPRNLSATGAQTAMLPPGATAKDEYDLAYGYMLRKDYALAESGLRDFLRKYPNDRLVAEANYWLGESLYQRQRYRDAAESFLTVSTKYEKSSKAPEALLRLGQSLAALREREAACATYAEIGRKFPNAPGSVKQAVERERKNTRC